MLHLLYAVCRRIVIFVYLWSVPITFCWPYTGFHSRSSLWYNPLSFSEPYVHICEHFLLTFLLSLEFLCISIPFLAFLKWTLIGQCPLSMVVWEWDLEQGLSFWLQEKLSSIFDPLQIVYSGMHPPTSWPKLILCGSFHACIIWLSNWVYPGWP